MVKGSYGLFNHKIGVDLDKTETELGKFALPNRMVVEPKKNLDMFKILGDYSKILLTIKITPNSPQKLIYVENLKARLQ